MNGVPVIVGGGAAGLTAALCLAPRPVILLSGAPLGSGTASAWAQGGIAAAIGPDDATALHVADTIAAGAGLCDPAAVARIIEAAPWAIEFLRRHGSAFAMLPDGQLALGLEAAHRRRRIVHAADATGAEVMRALQQAVLESPSITVIEQARAQALSVRDNRIRGLHVSTPKGMRSIATSIVILATGGIGGLFTHTTNPTSAIGSGLVMAARAGARLRDIEFVQFHPTALACGDDPMPLISEAVRGEGAVFVDQHGTPFMQGEDLAARDVVARAVAAKYAEGDSVFLDARGVERAHFPGMFAACQLRGIDPAVQPIPVRPAAHYHMGGVAVNAECESSVEGLFAIGEAACTGLHGANRLASNSLLEAIVTGRIAAEACAGREMKKLDEPGPAQRETRRDSLAPIRAICSGALGIRRDAAALSAAIARLEPHIARSDAALLVWAMAHVALQREESRGAHFRVDFPEPSLMAEPSVVALDALSGLELAA